MYLDRRYHGFHFRIIKEQNEIRGHIKIFLNHDQAENLETPLQPSDKVQIICAISGW